MQPPRGLPSARPARRKGIKRLAWEEFQITREITSPGSYELTIEAWCDRPRWFVPFELGYALGSGPSLEYTLANLREINRKHRQMLRAMATPPKVPKRMTPKHQQRAFKKLLKRSGNPAYLLADSARSAS